MARDKGPRIFFPREEGQNIGLNRRLPRITQRDVLSSGCFDYSISQTPRDKPGAATITNWARAILVIDPGKNAGVYRFIAAKRGKRIGWGLDHPVFETYWAHSQEPDKLLWVPANEAEIKAEAKSHKDVQAGDLLPFIPGADEEPAIIEVQTFQRAARSAVSQNQPLRVEINGFKTGHYLEPNRLWLASTASPFPNCFSDSRNNKPLTL